jgi:hypothetical protein
MPKLKENRNEHKWQPNNLTNRYELKNGSRAFLRATIPEVMGHCDCRRLLFHPDELARFLKEAQTVAGVAQDVKQDHPAPLTANPHITRADNLAIATAEQDREVEQ